MEVAGQLIHGTRWTLTNVTKQLHPRILATQPLLRSCYVRGRWGFQFHTVRQASDDPAQRLIWPPTLSQSIFGKTPLVNHNVVVSAPFPS